MKLFKSASKATLLVLLLFPVFTFAGLPDPGMTITQGRTALVLTDPQNDFLSPRRALPGAWSEKA